VDDAASSADNSCSISQPSTPAPAIPSSSSLDDAFIPGVRSLRRRLVINDNSRTVSSKSRKRPAIETQESTIAKLAKASEVVGSRLGSGHQAVTGPALAESRLTSIAGSKQRPVRPSTPGTASPTQRAVLRIAQPDGTVCFLAIDNVSNISRLPVTAVIQQLLASQKLASANHRLSLSNSAGLVPGFVGCTPRVTATSGTPIQPPPAVMSVPVIAPPQSDSSVSASLFSHDHPMSSVPCTSVSFAALPSIPVPSQVAPLPILRPQSSSNTLSEAFNRMRSQNALAQLFQNRGLSLHGIPAQSVNSQAQLLNNIMAVRAAALPSASPQTSSAVRILPFVADQPTVAFAVPVAVTMQSKLSSALSAAITATSQPFLSALPNTGKPGQAVTVVSSSIGQNLLLLNANAPKIKDMLASGVASVTTAPVVGNQSVLVNVIACHESSLPCSTGAVIAQSSMQQITAGNPTSSTVSSMRHIPRLAMVRNPFADHRSDSESSLALAVRAAVAAGRAPNLLSPLNRPHQPRYVNNLTVKTLLENRAASTTDSSSTPSSVAAVMCSSSVVSTSLVESSKLTAKPTTLMSSASSDGSNSNLMVQRTGTVVCTTMVVASSPIAMQQQQLASQSVLALLPAGVNIGPARIQQLVAVSSAAVSVAKPTVGQISLTSAVAARSRNVDVGPLQAIMPHSKSRAAPSRPVRNNTRTTSVMKAPIPALPRLTDLGLATPSSAEQTPIAGSAVLTAALSPVSVPSIVQSQALCVTTGPVSRPSVAVSSMPQQSAFALVRTAATAVNKPVIMAAGSSSLVVPPTNNPTQVFLLQNANGGLVQLVQLPAVAQTKSAASCRPNLLSQQVVLAPGPTASASALQLLSASSAPTANLSKAMASTPIVQFVVCSSSSSSSSSSLTAVNSAFSPAAGLPVCSTSTMSPAGVISQQPVSVISSPPSTVGLSQFPGLTKQQSSSHIADQLQPVATTRQPCIVVSRHQSGEFAKTCGLAEAADLFLMAASVVDRASATDAGVTEGPSSTVMSSSASSSLLSQTDR